MVARRLSKSKLLSAWQCAKRLYLEFHHPELASVDSTAQDRLAAGQAVGQLAREILGEGQGTLIPFEGGLAHALRKSRRLVRSAPAGPIFEATFEYQGVLVRTDALIPSGSGWELVEVKSATSPEPYHYFDCAVQDWVLRGIGVAPAKVVLAHVDATFEYPGNSRYNGLLRQVDVHENIRELDDEVTQTVRVARQAIAGEEPQIAVGKQCFTPFRCPFVEHCWPVDTDGRHSLLELPRAYKSKLGEWVARGFWDLADLPPEELTDKQRRVQRVVASGRPEILPSVGQAMRRLDYPRYYLDFESLGPAIPRFPGMRPYRALPFQWSCHFEPSAGELDHAEFLDLSGEPPFRRVAESLLRALGRSGPILVYSPYEATMIRRLEALFPDLAESLTALRARIVDLKPIVEAGFYHPQMRGSWSIKALLPHVDAALDYKKLVGIQDGMAASSAYLEAVSPDSSTVRIADIDRQLRRYCRLDTLAMVSVQRFFAAQRPGTLGAETKESE